MAARRGSRFIKPLLYTTGAGVAGSAALYFAYRPRDIPGTEAAAVPPPTYGEGGVFRPPQFPQVKSREDQIADLKRSGGIVSNLADKAKKALGSGAAASESEAEDNVYDLLIIGGGATGAGIALDAVTRGLKVAMVERDDFSSGTSSKSTKLVHGGVRYLEKAVWNLDYNQYVTQTTFLCHMLMQKKQVQARRRSPPRTPLLPRYRAASVTMAPHHDSSSEMVAGSVFLGWHQVLRLPRWLGEHRKLILLDEEQGSGFFPHAEEGGLGRGLGLLRRCTQ